MWYVYFLRLNNGDTYVGSTNDLRRRVRSHERGQVDSTRGHGPVSWSWDFTQQPNHLLLADRPCIFARGIDDPDLVIALPLGPWTL